MGTPRDKGIPVAVRPVMEDGNRWRKYWCSDCGAIIDTVEVVVDAPRQKPGVSRP